MGTVIDVRKYMEQKNAQKVEVIKKAAISNPRHEKLNTAGLSTKALVGEYLKNDKNLLKLAVYIIEQYGYVHRWGKKYVFEEVKRDMKYCEVQPEVSKRLKAHLGVKINGEWNFIEVRTTYSDSFDKKFNVIGNYNIKGYQIQVESLSSAKMKRIVEAGNLEEIVNRVHDIVYSGMSYGTFPFTYENSVYMPDIQKCVKCNYRMLEMDMPQYAILEGTEIRGGQKHLVLLYSGEDAKIYAKQYREKYAEAGVPLYYSKMSKYGLSIGEVCWKKLFQGDLKKKLVS